LTTRAEPAVPASIATTRLSRRLTRNTLTLLISNLGGAGLSFLLSALIGRTLGAEGLGVYAATMAWLLPLSLIAEFGLSTLMTRDIGLDLDSAHPYLETVTRSRLLMGGAIMLLLIIVAPLMSSDPLVVAGLQISAPLVMIGPFFSALSSIYKVRGQMWPIPYLNIGMLIVQVALTFVALRAGGGVIAVLILNVVTSAGQLIAAWWIYRWRFYDALRARLKAAPPLMPILRRAVPFALAAFFATLQTRLSVILLERLATTAQVGYFSAAARFVEAARLVPNAFFGALFPALAVLAADRLLLNQAFRRGMLAIGVFGLAAGVAFSLLALPLLKLTYGDPFSPAALVLQILGWSLFFSLLRGARTLYLYALGQESRVNRVNAIVIVIQLILSLLLIPVLGALGVAGIHVLIEVAALALLWRNETP
jgi:O-antigen/teichoic acid export membrane protein